MNTEQEKFFVYETENSVIFAIYPDFDIKLLKLSLGENFAKFVIANKIYKEVRFQKKIDPISAKTSLKDNMIRIEIQKKFESFIEIDFSDYELKKESDTNQINKE